MQAVSAEGTPCASFPCAWKRNRVFVSSTRVYLLEHAPIRWTRRIFSISSKFRVFFPPPFSSFCRQSAVRSVVKSRTGLSSRAFVLRSSCTETLPVSSLKRLQGVMLDDEEPGSFEASAVDDWLNLTLPPLDSPPRAPAFEFPETLAAEISPVVEIPRTPVAEFPQSRVVGISSSPSTSAGSVPVGKHPRIHVEIPRPSVNDLTSSPSPPPRPVPVGGGNSQQPLVIDLSSSSGTSDDSVLVVGASPSAFAEASSSRSDSRGATPVAGRRKAKRKRSLEEVPFVEVTVVSPPSLDADKFSPMQARIEWTKQAAAVLPSRILVAAPRRRNSTMQQIYHPCSSWQEFIDHRREAQSRREETRVERHFKRTAPRTGPVDSIGCSRAAVEEIYRQRLNPEVFRKLSLLDN